MPTLTRVFIKTALTYLLAALAAGSLLLAGQAAGVPPPVRLLLQPVYVHLFVVGWVTQLIFGVAWWLFPPRSREAPRGDERLAWFVYAALNAGLLLRVVGEPLHAARPGAVSARLLVLSALLQAAAGWVFAAHLWPRVKGRAGETRGADRVG